MNFWQLLKDKIKNANKDEEVEVKYIVKNNPSASKTGHRNRNRGIGFTRRVHEESKTKRKIAKKSRRINRK